jgi:hypothetical protein
MNDVRIKKESLIEIVAKNRADHRDIFLKAQDKYRGVVIQLLDKTLADARDGRPFVLNEITRLVMPVDHTKDYDRALLMLDLEVEQVVTLDENAFANLVQDQWNWSRAWAVSNSQYTDSPKFRQALE